MLVPMQWLKQYIEVESDMEMFSDKMIMSGSNIETVTRFGEEIENVVVGKILSIERHPDADKLVVTKVQIGDQESVQIVTGATNLFEGAYIPVALHNSKLPGGKSIKKGKLRGIESNGMLCSASELGFSDKVIPLNHRDGIWILEEEFPLGQDIVTALGLKEAVVDFEITPNRPDCLSMLGMARETAATLGGKMQYPQTHCNVEEGLASEFIQIKIHKPELCKRYVARVVKDVKVEPSPWWLQQRLIFAGMRPINNIVDITNYVMLEYGQPLHAFDIRDLEDQLIQVDTAKEGEIFITLDGSERKLTENMLLIKDGKRAVAIAGVMGGLNSEIKDDTQTILIESANFNGDSIRATSKKLVLRTEASSRFEKGIDPNLCSAAADRVCHLIEAIGAGKVIGGNVDEYPGQVEEKAVAVRVQRVNSVLGIQLKAQEMQDIFERLEMRVESDGQVLIVTPPTVRQDLLKEIDFIEEIARIYGYDRMPITLPKGHNEAKKSFDRTLKDLMRDSLTSMGANEVQTYSFVSPKGVSQIKAENDANLMNFVKIINPLGEENSVMRTTLIPNMLETLGRNYSRNIEKVRAFEIGNTFVNIASEQIEGLPTEKDSLVIASYGQEESFFTLKGMIEELFSKLGISQLSFVQEEQINTYHPGRCARVLSNGTELGVMGEIHPDVSENFEIGCKCYCAEFSVKSIIAVSNVMKYYKPLPKYPAMVRDIALLVEEEIKADQLKQIIVNSAGEILESVTLFDVYRGKNIPVNQKSIAYSLVYRASDRTLTDEEVAKVHSSVLENLEKQACARLRAI